MTKKQRRIIADALLRASRAVDDNANQYPLNSNRHMGACVAIWWGRTRFLPIFGESEASLAEEIFGRIFNPKHQRGAYWFGEREGRAEKRNRNRRVFALLLAREMVLGGDEP